MAEQVITFLDSYGIDTTIYTVGSCSEGTSEGGSAAVITSALDAKKRKKM